MTAPKWRDCADPDELAAAVAAGVEVFRKRPDEVKWSLTGAVSVEHFTGNISRGVRYQLPTAWTWHPEPPATDELRERIARAMFDRDGFAVRWDEASVNTTARYSRLADAVLAVLPAPPTPPWPGAVLSGLVDEDGVPTWLAQAGQVRGEQVRIWHGEPWVTTHGSWADSRWVEVRAPRAVPEPETERVPWYRAPGRRQPGGDLLGPIVQAYPNPNLPGGMYVEYELPEHGTTTGNPNRHPDGMVEVLKDGAR